MYNEIMILKSYVLNVDLKWNTNYHFLLHYIMITLSYIKLIEEIWDFYSIYQFIKIIVYFSNGRDLTYGGDLIKNLLLTYKF